MPICLNAKSIWFIAIRLAHDLSIKKYLPINGGSAMQDFIKTISDAKNSCESSVFALAIDEELQNYTVSTEALYMLCKHQDTSINQIDAYFQLKKRVHDAVERRLARNTKAPNTPLESCDFVD